MDVLLRKRWRWLFVIVIVVLVVVSGLLSFRVKTNYDLSAYLPEDSKTSIGLNVLEDSFGNHAQVEMMIKDVSLEEALMIKNEINGMDGVLQVVWLDDYMTSEDIEDISPSIVNMFYYDNHAMYIVVFEGNAYDLEIEKVVEAISDGFSDKEVFFRGDAIQNIESRTIAQKEVLKMILIILPISLFVLILVSKSWIEPLIILIVLGVGIILNLGTNIIFPQVSFITLTIASALQLAISLDYSLFFIHRYYELKDDGKNMIQSIRLSFKYSIPVITASFLTTVVGFLSLLILRYKIGADIGLVLSKGVLLSFLAVVFVLPLLLVVFDQTIEKTRHKSLHFHIGFLKTIMMKFRYVFLALFILLMGLGLFYQNKVSFLYGNSQFGSERSIVEKDRNEMAKHFTEYQPILVLIKDSTQELEINLIQSFLQLNTIERIDALYTQVNPMIPKESLPYDLVSSYEQNGYTRMVMYSTILEENDEAYQLANTLIEILDGADIDYHLIGSMISIQDVKTTVNEDGWKVVVFSSLFIIVVLSIVFKNIKLPILLVIVIQTAIWLNMGLLSINHRPVIYIGYLVVMAIQLGATIDYAVLLASRYMESRKQHHKDNAIYLSLKTSTMPLFISGSILAIAGFVQMLFSENNIIGDIGLLIGRGALLSLFMVLIFLPVLLIICDRFFKKM